MGKGSKNRLAIIVSHPIQYYVPLYRHLARRDDVAIRVFFTWHVPSAVEDHGFNIPVAWDIPLTAGYDFDPQYCAGKVRWDAFDTYSARNSARLLAGAVDRALELFKTRRLAECES